jgi:hypothetical protein
MGAATHGSEALPAVYRERVGAPCRRLAWTTVAAAAVLAACSADDAACEPAAAPASCADLVFRGGQYNEWREHDTPPPAQMQEVGNATYPDCNIPEGCPGSELDGFGATDVYLIDGVDIEDAVIGFRQGSEATVIFVRVGTDPDGLPIP